MQPIWWRNVRLPAGKAVRLVYRARFSIGGKRLDAAITQYAMMGTGGATVLTYTTLPRLAKGYRATFERSAVPDPRSNAALPDFRHRLAASLVTLGRFS